MRFEEGIPEIDPAARCRGEVRFHPLLLAALILWFACHPAHGAESGRDIQIVRATGSALIRNGDLPGAKKKGILNAKRNAVEQVGTRILSRTVVENFLLVKDKVIAKADGHVHRYRILREDRDEETYRVEIEAEVSESSLIEDALSVYHDMNKPRVMVILPEIRDRDAVPTSHAENVVSEFFVGREITLVDSAAVKEKIRKEEMRKLAEGDPAAAAKIGLDAGAEVVVTGTATVGNAQSVREVMYASKGSCTARAIRTSNASLYAVSSVSKSAADGIAEGAQRKAVEATCLGVAQEIFWKIVKKWNDELMSGGDVEIVLSGVSFSTLRKVIDALRQVDEVTEVVQRSFDAPAAILSVNYRGDAMQLADRIDEKKFAGLDLEIQTVTAGKINIRVK